MVLTAERGLISQVLTIVMALNVCQFNATEAATLVKECFPTFEAFLLMKEKDISSVADDYSKRINAQSRIIFGLYCTNELKGLMYWVQDMKRMSKDPESQVLTSDDIQLAMDNTGHP
jgi:Txe/YoeB family toxin of Txe-Axe toxin-antitoxin module